MDIDDPPTNTTTFTIAYKEFRESDFWPALPFVLEWELLSIDNVRKIIDDWITSNGNTIAILDECSPCFTGSSSSSSSSSSSTSSSSFLSYTPSFVVRESSPCDGNCFFSSVASCLETQLIENVYSNLALNHSKLRSMCYRTLMRNLLGLGGDSSFPTTENTSTSNNMDSINNNNDHTGNLSSDDEMYGYFQQPFPTFDSREEVETHSPFLFRINKIARHVLHLPPEWDVIWRNFDCLVPESMFSSLTEHDDDDEESLIIPEKLVIFQKIHFVGGFLLDDARNHSHADHLICGPVMADILEMDVVVLYVNEGTGEIELDRNFPYQNTKIKNRSNEYHTSNTKNRISLIHFKNHFDAILTVCEIRQPPNFISTPFINNNDDDNETTFMDLNKSQEGQILTKTPIFVPSNSITSSEYIKGLNDLSDFDIYATNFKNCETAYLGRFKYQFCLTQSKSNSKTQDDLFIFTLDAKIISQIKDLWCLQKQEGIFHIGRQSAPYLTGHISSVFYKSLVGIKLDNTIENLGSMSALDDEDLHFTYNDDKKFSKFILIVSLSPICHDYETFFHSIMNRINDF